MTWLFTLLAMAVIALVAGVVTGRITGAMAPAETSLPFRGLPPDDVAPADLEALRFDAALRGYRMSEVDDVLDRLADELRRRDVEIVQLRAALAAMDAKSAAPDPAVSGPDDSHGSASGDAAGVDPASVDAASVDAAAVDPAADGAAGRATPSPYGPAPYRDVSYHTAFESTYGERPYDPAYTPPADPPGDGIEAPGSGVPSRPDRGSS